MLMVYRKGVSTIVIILILAVFLLAVGLLAFNSTTKSREQREQVRKSDLEKIARAQEDYYDQFERYTENVVELKNFVKYELPSDPYTHKPYMVFVSTDGQVWCAAAQSEIVEDQYFIQDNARASVINKLPVNVASCR